MPNGLTAPPAEKHLWQKAETPEKSLLHNLLTFANSAQKEETENHLAVCFSPSQHHDSPDKSLDHRSLELLEISQSAVAQRTCPFCA